MADFRNALLAYLESEKSYCEADIAAKKNLSDDEKEAEGLVVRNAHIVRHEGMEYELAVTVNNSKLRPGDSVLLKNISKGKSANAKIIENGFYRISLSCVNELDLESEYRIEVLDIVLLDPIINLLKGIEEGVPGSNYLSLLAGLEPAPRLKGVGALNLEDVEYIFPDYFNSEQLEACKKAIQRPSLYCIQGPPGTGKTDVLSRIAHAYCEKQKSILVISNTHQAVNNALNKIAKNAVEATIVKVGEALKAEGLDDSIIRVKSYNEYSSSKKGNKNASSYEVIGMTLHAAVMNLGLKHNDFNPSIILVDEAGQMPLTYAACIGAFGCGCVVFIGDDKQMPPIYHPKLVDDPISTSIFSFLTGLYPEFKTRLRVTYRMNDKITDVVSRNFYESDGESLIASDFSKSRRLMLPSNSGDDKIDFLLKCPQPIIRWNPSTLKDCEDLNVEEAMFIANLIKEALNKGMETSDIAVITPYRRQVRTIRECVGEVLGTTDELPLIDTVERLQGQDVDLIIISFCVTDPKYFEINRTFLFNPNRLNVMISRAKKKVVIIGSDLVQTNLKL